MWPGTLNNKENIITSKTPDSDIIFWKRSLNVLVLFWQKSIF